MSGTLDDNPSAAAQRIAAVRAARARTENGRGLDQIDGDLGRAWVRLALGRNRGEQRTVHGTTASFDSLLDERLAAAPKVDKTPATGVVGG